ncbi:MAG: patatin-like phospholipase family protein [Candidatus Saccharibacteria bacterium]
MNSGRNALVVEGGGMRGIFTAGVLDAFQKEGFDPFNLYLGVSAGAYNLASFLAGMERRNYRIYTEYAVRKEYMNFWRFTRGGHLLDLDWILSTTNREMGLDLERLFGSPKEYYIGLTEVSTGRAERIIPDRKNLTELLKASMAIPLLHRGFINVNGKDYVDGGLVDPIPVRFAHELGATNIMVLRTRLHSYVMKPGLSENAAGFLLRKYPKLVEATYKRPNVYQQSIDFLRNPPAGVKIIEINPPEAFQTQRLTTRLDVLDSDYNLGVSVGLDAMQRWQ